MVQIRLHLDKVLALETLDDNNCKDLQEALKMLSFMAERAQENAQLLKRLHEKLILLPSDLGSCHAAMVQEIKSMVHKADDHAIPILKVAAQALARIMRGLSKPDSVDEAFLTSIDGALAILVGTTPTLGSLSANVATAACRGLEALYKAWRACKMPQDGAGLVVENISEEDVDCEQVSMNRKAINRFNAHLGEINRAKDALAIAFDSEALNVRNTCIEPLNACQADVKGKLLLKCGDVVAKLSQASSVSVGA